MAIGRPVIVQGERGFSLPFAPETYDTFLWQGFWGVGDGSSGASRLAGHLETLVVDPERRSRLGEYGRSVIVERFSLRRAADIMEEIYSDVADMPGRSSVGEAARVASRALGLAVREHRPSVKRKRASSERARLESAATESTEANRTSD
jgi:hypothetical protein